MKRYLTKLLLLCVWLAGVFLLGGCQLTTSVEELLTLPQLSLEYEGLSQQIDDLIARGYEYASPTNGHNIQSVQMVDLDGDGSDESVAFFRKNSDEKPLKIVVFHRQDSAYQPLCTLESSGTEVESVTYQDLTGDGIKEIIVGWKISADVQTVAAYKIQSQPETLMRSNYVKFTIQPLSRKDTPDLVVLHSNEEGDSVAELYNWDNDTMAVRSLCTLSSTMADLNRGSITSGKLGKKTLALYITGINDQNMAVTDILVSKKGNLVNLVENRHTGTSDLVYPYHQLLPQDIDGDGAVEIPFSTLSPKAAQHDGLIAWKSYDAQGQGNWRLDTYHALSSGWYLTLSGDWHERIVAQASENGRDESQVLIQVDGNDLAAIYIISGENRENRAAQGNRFILKRQTSQIYAAELFPDSDVYGMNETFLRKNFKLIMGNWTAMDN